MTTATHQQTQKGEREREEKEKPIAERWLSVSSRVISDEKGK
jgi:hypothetical protein